MTKRIEKALDAAMEILKPKTNRLARKGLSVGFKAYMKTPIFKREIERINASIQKRLVAEQEKRVTENNPMSIDESEAFVFDIETKYVLHKLSQFANRQVDEVTMEDEDAADAGEMTMTERLKAAGHKVFE